MLLDSNTCSYDCHSYGWMTISMFDYVSFFFLGTLIITMFETAAFVSCPIQLCLLIQRQTNQMTDNNVVLGWAERNYKYQWCHADSRRPTKYFLLSIKTGFLCHHHVPNTRHDSAVIIIVALAAYQGKMLRILVLCHRLLDSTGTSWVNESGVITWQSFKI